MLARKQTEIIQIAIDGEQKRGSDGVVVVDENTETIQYLLVPEIERPEIRAHVTDMLSDDENKHFFVMHVTSDKIDVHKLDKMKVFTS